MPNKISKRLAEDLLTLCHHAQVDMDYGVGGSYNDGDDNFNNKDAKQAQRAIEYLKRKFISQHYVV